MDREDIINVVIQAAGRAFKKSPSSLTPETNLLNDLKAKSVNFFILMTELGSTYDIEFQYQEFRSKARTISDIVDLIESKGGIPEKESSESVVKDAKITALQGGSVHDGEVQAGTEYWDLKGGTDHLTFSDAENIIVKRVYESGEEVEVLCRRQPLSMGFGMNYYPKSLEPGTHIVDGMIYDRDVAVPMRDGTVMYIDIYRPVEHPDNLPVVMGWTSYGKRHWHGLKEVPGLQQAMGVPVGTLSVHGIFEGPDPLFWCPRGFAVVNADMPGSGLSEGDLGMHSVKGGKDGYDCIEWLAQQKWCNGKVGMSGNSNICMSQWWIAAEHPPHLAAIAPWEGTADLYRESLAPGGIQSPVFAAMIVGGIRGLGLVDDIGGMIMKYPLWNAYWEDRAAKLEEIDVPSYVTAGYCHPFHLRSSVLAFERMKSKNKWIRLHREFEWADYNRPENKYDLYLFFERYLKNVRNGWELTPKVRVEVTDAYDFDYVTNRPENEWPLARTKYTRLYLDAASKTLAPTPFETETCLNYDALTGEVSFDMVFEEETEITGHAKLRLWIEAEGSDDVDLFVHLQKSSAEGEFIPTDVFGQADPGAPGYLRVSHRHLDDKKSTEWLPIHTHDREEMLRPGQIVPVDIEIWPNSRIWHEGERLRIRIAGRVIRDETWFLPTETETRNKGQHIIHTGGKYESYLLAPIIPPRYQVGDYIRRW